MQGLEQESKTRALLALIKKMYQLMNKSPDEMQSDLSAAGIDPEALAEGDEAPLKDMAQDMSGNLGGSELEVKEEDDDEDLKSFFHGRKTPRLEGTMTMSSAPKKKPMPKASGAMNFGKQQHGKR